ncbi:hypothetical protein ACSLNR_28615, partial [Escherichia coli]
QLNPVVNSLLKERIIHSPKELEHDNAVIRALQKLQIQEVCNSILWVEHQDKGRLELNFVIPNMELANGKRLQPYYDRADRPR